MCDRKVKTPTNALPPENAAASRAETQESAWQVFISAKKLDLEGRPTRDTELAEMLHQRLTEQGLRVFLSTRSLEQMGAAVYKTAIDKTLDQCSVLIAVGTSTVNLDSGWVKYEWDSFFNDIISGVKADGRVFVYVENVTPAELPRPLRQCETFQHAPGEEDRLLGFIYNALPNPQKRARPHPSIRQPHPTASGIVRPKFRWRKLAWGLLLMILLAFLGYFAAKPYRQQRMLSFLDPFRRTVALKAVPAVVPKHGQFYTAWIFLGYLDSNNGIYLEGPFAAVVYRATGSERGAIAPRIGDVLGVTKDRQLVIADFRTKGDANEYISPPLINATLTSNDLTGQIAPKGSFVIVRDVEISGETGRASSVWCRVAQCDHDSPGCAKAQAELQN